jgi:maltodextrin utilization protein YvdJ
MIYFIWFVLAVSILNLAMLSFAFRDFSFLLVLQFLFSAVLIPVATYQITRHYYPLPNLVLVTEDETTGKLTHWWSYSEDKDKPNVDRMYREDMEEEEDFKNLQRGFFDNCH